MARGQLRNAVNEQCKVKLMVHSVVKPKNNMVVDSKDEQVGIVVR